MSFLTLTYNIFDTRIFGYKYLDYDAPETAPQNLFGGGSDE